MQIGNGILVLERFPPSQYAKAVSKEVFKEDCKEDFKEVFKEVFKRDNFGTRIGILSFCPNPGAHKRTYRIRSNLQTE